MNNNTYRITVPCTSANLGSGFDTLGIAFNLYNTFTIKELETDELIIEGVSEEFQNRDNLFYRSCCEVFRRLDKKIKGLYIIEENHVPFGKGLGSSATCVVGGLVGANALCGNILKKNEILDIASKMEGHPDNVAPALFGNLTASMMLEDRTISLIDKVHPGFSFFACIPNFELLTQKARKILPETYPASDIVFNISHSIMTFESLRTGNTTTLKFSLDDRLHQPYRYKLIENNEKLLEFIEKQNYIGSYLSGAGPTIVVITEKERPGAKIQLETFISKNMPGWEVMELLPDHCGTTITVL